MPIKSIAAQTARNARRRLQRAADRAAKEAQKGGAYGARMEQLSKQFAAQKEGLYQKPGGGYDLKKLSAASDFKAAQVMDEAQQANILMHGPVGQRVFAATYEIWGDLPYEQRKKAVLKAFKTNNYKNLIKKLEKWFGSSIYGDMTQEKYDEVVTLIMQYLETGEVPKKQPTRQRQGDRRKPAKDDAFARIGSQLMLDAPLIESKKAKAAYKAASKKLKAAGRKIGMDMKL